MLRVQSLLAVAVLFVAGSYASAQHAIIKPGDVIAGKTLTGASDIAVSDNGRLVFRGAFEEGGKQQAALFDYDLSTKAAKMIASTETAFDGFLLTDVGQPSLSSTGKLVWRGATEQGAVIFGDDGPLVKTGDSIAQGKTAVDPYEPLINDAGTILFFDGFGGFQYPSGQFAEFPWLVDGLSLGAPLANSSTFVNFGLASFVESKHGNIASFSPSGGNPNLTLEVNSTLTRVYDVSMNQNIALSMIVDRESARSVVVNWNVVADQNDLLDDGTKLGAMTEIELTNSLLVYVASEGRVIQLPEPSTARLAVIAILGLAVWAARRFKRS